MVSVGTVRHQASMTLTMSASVPQDGVNFQLTDSALTNTMTMGATVAAGDPYNVEVVQRGALTMTAGLDLPRKQFASGDWSA